MEVLANLIRNMTVTVPQQSREVTLTYKALKYFCINHEERRAFSILNDHNCLIIMPVCGSTVVHQICRFLVDDNQEYFQSEVWTKGSSHV